MSHHEPTLTTARHKRSGILDVLIALSAVASVVVSAAAIGVRDDQSLAAPSPAPPPIASPPIAAPPLAPPPPPVRLNGDAPDAPGEGAGVIPDGVTVFDDGYPAVTKLNPHLLGALRHAARDAANDGVTFFVNSGWRSRAYQNQLLREAVSRYGSEVEAARWVATADASPHVSGNAVDIGPARAAAWLSKHGAKYGLCQIYKNEPWHYELRPKAINRGCPPVYADPTHDPRMQ
jgi:zinc D-Ala-D-Ala carboxypeptidase